MVQTEGFYELESTFNLDWKYEPPDTFAGGIIPSTIHNQKYFKISYRSPPRHIQEGVPSQGGQHRVVHHVHLEHYQGHF